MKRCKALFCVALAGVFLAAMVAGSYAADKGSTIKIGLLLDLTGSIGPGGIDMQKGTMLALEKLGDSVAGKKIQFVVEDSASDAGVSVDKAKKLVETDKVALIIGPINGGGSVAVGAIRGPGARAEGRRHDDPRRDRPARLVVRPRGRSGSGGLRPRCLRP